MNEVAVTILVTALALVVLALVFSRLFERELVLKVEQTISWLLKVSYFDFVKLVIFIKPLKKYILQVGILLWLVLAFVTGRYLVVDQPKINEIAGPYIPMIGYVIYVSALFVVQFVLRITRRSD
jgi:hypothetical protein